MRLDRPAPALRNPARSCASRHLGQRRGGGVRRPRRAIRAPRPYHRCARAGRCARQQALRPESHGCGAGNHRGQPTAFRGSAHRYWDTMGLVIASIHEKRDEFRRMLQAPERERHAFRTPRPLPGE
jgi:hypothetical protein